MSRRLLFLDDAPGERRVVVTLDGRPERLFVERQDDASGQRLGARAVARLRRIDRTLATAFLDLGGAAEAILPLVGAARALAEGAAVEVEIVTEARRGKGAIVRLIGPAEGAPRLLSAGPTLEQCLASFAPGQAVVAGAEAREAADEAEEAVLAVDHALPGGGSIAIEPTRALTAVDVDMGAAAGEARRAARRTNLTAIAEAARLLRLKALGGLVIIDLVGTGHDGAALAAAAAGAFAPDQPGVSIGPVSRFGLLQLALPRRYRPVGEILNDSDGAPSATTTALRLLRSLERAGRADGGARLLGRCAPMAATAAEPYIQSLADRIGQRFEIRADPALAGDQIEVSTR